jgi:hypothetical protein
LKARLPLHEGIDDQPGRGIAQEPADALNKLRRFDQAVANYQKAVG